MMTEATMMREVIGSCSRSQPRKTATMGFTYAKVDTRAGVLCFISQTNVEKPTSEPALTR